MNKFRSMALFGVLAVAGASQAVTFTVATFADPSPNGGTPLFTLAQSGSNVTLSGSWTGLGLTLQTPGLPAIPDIANAKFVMAPIIGVVAGFSVQYGAGSIQFTDASNNPILNIAFQSAWGYPLGFGGSTLVGNGVTFSGPNVQPLSQETFGFTFANPAIAPQGDLATYTASFTSSAVPEPATMLALATGAALLVARRRRA